MTNPATRLHEIFTDWREGYGKNVEALEARGFRTAPEEAYQRHVEAFRLLIQIDHALEYLQERGIPVRVYVESKKPWLAMILNYPLHWQGASNGGEAFPPESMAHLETLGTLLELDRPQLSPEPEATLREAISSVMKLLAADESISPTLRGYIFKLVNEVRTALDDESIAGSFEFAEAAERLWVAMNAAAGQSKSHKAGWKSSAGDFFKDAGSAAIGSMPSLALSVAQLLATSS